MLRCWLIHMIVFYLCIHGKCNPYDYVTMTHESEGLFSASQIHRFYFSKTQAICPPTPPLTSLTITPKDYQLLYVF